MYWEAAMTKELIDSLNVSDQLWCWFGHEVPLQFQSKAADLSASKGSLGSSSYIKKAMGTLSSVICADEMGLNGYIKCTGYSVTVVLCLCHWSLNKFVML